MYVDNDMLTLASPLMITCQILLHLAEHANTNDELSDLYHMTSGAFFLGCTHDERSHNFGDRVAQNLDEECKVGSLGPAAEWIESITKRFRELRLPFPVWSYCESEVLVHEPEPTVSAWDITQGEKVRVL
jgi:hypothetical protein